MQATASAQQAASHKPEPANGSAVLSNAPFGGEVEPAVDIRCSRCRWHTLLHLSDLVDRCSPEVSVSEVVRRLRCGGFRGDSKCRAKPSHVSLVEVSYYGKSMRKLREVVVVDVQAAQLAATPKS
jgi:hypothetical protein